MDLLEKYTSAQEKFNTAKERYSNSLRQLFEHQSSEKAKQEVRESIEALEEPWRNISIAWFNYSPELEKKEPGFFEKIFNPDKYKKEFLEKTIEQLHSELYMDAIRKTGIDNIVSDTSRASLYQNELSRLYSKDSIRAAHYSLLATVVAIAVALFK